ncbi:hypothetical protein DTO212C5_4060 [Paecilomyces variotii]|nr:hypothetical protein DTO169C6_5394 [Paecilomyces variotii]KAJ9269886.1 hypothetical protein DTO212C5_4060 [Paecilomyces variotii]
MYSRLLEIAIPYRLVLLSHGIVWELKAAFVRKDSSSRQPLSTYISFADIITRLRIKMVARRSSQRSSLPANLRRQPETKDPRHSSRKILNLSAGEDGEWTLSCVTKPYPVSSPAETGTPLGSSFRAKRRRVQKTPNAPGETADFNSDISRNSSSDISRREAFAMEKKRGNRKSSQNQRKELAKNEPVPPDNTSSNSHSKSGKDVSNVRSDEEAASEPNAGNPSQKKSLRLIFSRNPVDGKTTLRAEKDMPVAVGLGDSSALNTPTPATRIGREKRNASSMRQTTVDDTSVTVDTPSSRNGDRQNAARAGRSSQREASRRTTLESYFPSETRIQNTTPKSNDDMKPSEVKSNKGNTDSKLRLKLRQPAPPVSDTIGRIDTLESPGAGRQSRRRAARKGDERSNETSDKNMSKASGGSSESPIVTRTSSRVRKPTAKAIEALEQKPKLRKTAGGYDRPPSSAGKEEAQNSPEHDHTESVKPNTLQSSAAEEDFVARQMYELAAAALAPDFELSPDQNAHIKRLREEYESNEQMQNSSSSGKGSSSGDRTSAMAQPEPVLQTESVAPRLDHAGVSRPWTDEDGWVHTGQLNEYGEEIALVPETYTWIETINTHGDKELPKPPPQIKSLEQIEKDKVFGFPPPMGQRNLPQGGDHPFTTENVDFETAKIRARETAKSMGLTVDRSMSLAELEAIIHSHDASSQAKKRKRGAVVESKTTQLTPQRSTGATRKRRRTEGPIVVEKPAETLKRKSTGTNATDKTVTKKRRVSAPAQAERVEYPHSIDKGENKVTTAPSDDLSSPSQNGTGANKDTGAGGRPRRRAAAAMLAQIQSNAEARSRRARVRRKGSEARSDIQEDSGLGIGVEAKEDEAN